MITTRTNGVIVLQFESLLQFPNLKHGVFLRHGGVSCGGYDSLNLSFSVGDDPGNVQKNRETIQKIFESSHLVSSNQIHGSRVETVTHENLARDLVCDGLTTNRTDIGLLVTHADCQAAIFYDPMKNALAVVHSGWRGSVANIYQETILKMTKLYGSKACDIYVGISPSLGPTNAQFINYETELPKEFRKYQITPLYFDFWAISREQLQKCGILSNHIEIAERCTFNDPINYFSYRRQKIAGRHGTIGMLVHN